MVDKELAAEMRRDGMTMREIGEHFGVSHQRIQQILGNSVRCRKCTMDMEKIPYKGIYDYMVAHPKVTIPTLARVLYGERKEKASMARRFLFGANVKVNKRGIDRLIAKTGMTYEQLFELRDGCAEEAE